MKDKTDTTTLKREGEIPPFFSGLPKYVLKG